MKQFKFMGFLMFIGMIFYMVLPVCAEDVLSNEEIHETKITVKNKLGENVDVWFANENTGATYGDVQNIVNMDTNLDALSITIYEVKGGDKVTDSYPESSIRAWNPPPIGSMHYMVSDLMEAHIKKLSNIFLKYR